MKLINGGIVVPHEPQATTPVAPNQFVERRHKPRLQDIIHRDVFFYVSTCPFIAKPAGDDKETAAVLIMEDQRSRRSRCTMACPSVGQGNAPKVQRGL